MFEAAFKAGQNNWHEESTKTSGKRKSLPDISGIHSRLKRSGWALWLMIGALLATQATLPMALAHSPHTEKAPQHNDLVAAKPLVHITLLQLNDVYQIAPVESETKDGSQSGGLARVATLRQSIQAENPNTFMVLAGDTLFPSLGSSIYQGKQMIDLWNRVGLDVATLGNHEFDAGNAVLLERLKESKFPWVVANVQDKATGKPWANLPPYMIKEVDGVKIGFVGLITPDTAQSSSPGPDVQFTDPVIAACKAIGEMRQQGVDIIVAITHLPLNEDKRLANRMNQQIALIMGGHEHVLLQSLANGTPIFKVSSDAQLLGRIDLFVNPQTRRLDSMDWKMIPVTQAIPEDPAIAQIVKQYEDPVKAATGQPIGSTRVALDACSFTNRTQETNVGNLVADAYRAWMKTDVALINGGSIRAEKVYAPGPLTPADITTMLNFQNKVAKASLSGSQLKQALEGGVSRADAIDGRFPQVSGLIFTFDARKPVGSRVVEVKVNGQPLQSSKIYTLATSFYLLGGKDGYDALKQAKALNTQDDAPIETQIVQSAIHQAGGTIAPQLEKRIIRLDKPAVDRSNATHCSPADSI